jgi:hypothetical protein
MNPTTEFDTAAVTAATDRHRGHRTLVRYWFSARVRFPKWHLDPECEGLDNVQEDWRATQTGSLLSLLTMERGRPCRRCALERVLTASFNAPSVQRGRLQLVTFSGQPNPHEKSPFSYEYREVSESGAQRLVQIAQAWNMETVLSTPAGPVAWGLLPERLGQLVARNLRTLRCAPLQVAGPHHVSLVWEMLVNRPPEIGEDSMRDPALVWSLTRAIVAPAG